MISPKSIDFLNRLIDNNNREWFMTNKADYETARENVIEFTAQLINQLQKIDPNIEDTLDAKKCVMRIYRDIRFSKNKTPYKNNFGVSIPTIGSKLGGVEYYFHITPGKSFIAGGYWMPEAEHLKAIRQEIDYNAGDLKKIIDEPAFIKLFGNFSDQDKLKTVPKGYDAANENIGLLKLKSFIVSHDISDKKLCSAGAVDYVASVCSKLFPLTVFLRNALA